MMKKIVVGGICEPWILNTYSKYETLDAFKNEISIPRYGLKVVTDDETRLKGQVKR